MIMAETTLTVTHPVGLHARPAAVFYRAARQFQSRITIQNLSRPGTGEVQVSPINLMQIAVQQGHEICLRAEGEDAAAALAALTQLVENNFGEDV
jgi:phosphotransferase system HPr (HPr) family protein